MRVTHVTSTVVENCWCKQVNMTVSRHNQARKVDRLFRLYRGGNQDWHESKVRKLADLLGGYQACRPHVPACTNAKRSRPRLHRPIPGMHSALKFLLVRDALQKIAELPPLLFGKCRQ